MNIVSLSFGKRWISQATMGSASQWSVGGVWGKTSPNFEGSYGIVQKAQFWNVDNFFNSNLRKMKRGVRKLRKDSSLSNFSSHVVFGRQKILGKICSFNPQKRFFTKGKFTTFQKVLFLRVWCRKLSLSKIGVMDVSYIMDSG